MFYTSPLHCSDKVYVTFLWYSFPIIFDNFPTSLVRILLVRLCSFFSVWSKLLTYIFGQNSTFCEYILKILVCFDENEKWRSPDLVLDQTAKISGVECRLVLDIFLIYFVMVPVKIPSPVLRGPAVVHSDLRIPFSAYCDPL